MNVTKVIQRVKIILLILFLINPVLLLLIWDMIAKPSAQRQRRYLAFLYYADQIITPPAFENWHMLLDILMASSSYIIFTYGTILILMAILTGEYMRLKPDKEYIEE